MAGLKLKVVTPAGTLGSVDCDSVRLTVCDGPDGRGGGSYGIHAGHAKALLALGSGPIRAYLAGVLIFSGAAPGGFATVDSNTVTAMVESGRVKNYAQKGLQSLEG